MSWKVYSRDGCIFCDAAMELLEAKGIQYEERNIESGKWTTAQLLEAAPGVRSVPQIVIDGKLIGGYDKLKEFLK